MAIAGIKQMLKEARAEGYAVPGFVVWNAETIRAVLRAARQEQAPVILMSGPGEFLLLPSVQWRIALRRLVIAFILQAEGPDPLAIEVIKIRNADQDQTQADE